jgi:uncharacterized membrane protein
MSKFIGIIFPDDAKASEGSQVLKKLHAEGSLALSGMAIVSKDGTGQSPSNARPMKGRSGPWWVL